MSPEQDSTTWVAEIMRVRLKLCSLAIIASVLPTSVIFLVTGRWIPAGAAIAAQLVSGAGLVAVSTGRIPAARAGAVVFVEWFAVVIAVVLAKPAFGGANVQSWLVLLVVGYSIGQLERTWYLVGLVTAIGVVIASTNWISEPVGPHIVTLASMIGLSVLCWFSSGVFVNRLEQLRTLDARHAAELAEALSATSRALAEREAMEAERERVMEQLMLSQRMEAVGRLASGIAHDMNNVLAGVVGMASLIRNEVPTHVHDDLDAIISSGHRGAELTRSLLAFARHERMRDEQFELTRIAEEVQLIVRRTQPKTVNCELVITDRPIAMGDPTLVTQALLNLCLNAVDATSAQGTIAMELSTIDLALRDAEPFGLPAGRYAQLSVRDDGVGMDEDTRAHMFEPFFTTKALGEGTGLGLSMVYGTVRAHAGAIHATSAPGDGTTFTILLPALQRATIDLTDPHPPIAHHQGTGRSKVLIVDDDPLVLSVTGRLLTVAGFHTLQAVNGAEGLAIYARDHTRIGVVILDMSMPVMDGPECFSRLREISPDVKVILSTGYAEAGQLDACAALSPHAVVQKPFDPVTLIDAVRSAGPALAPPSGLAWRTSSLSRRSDAR